MTEDGELGGSEGRTREEQRVAFHSPVTATGSGGGGEGVGGLKGEMQLTHLPGVQVKPLPPPHSFKTPLSSSSLLAAQLNNLVVETQEI